MRGGPPSGPVHASICAVRVAMTMEQLWHRVPGGTGIAALGMAGALAARDGVDVMGVSARHRAAPDPQWSPPIPVEQLPLPRLALYESWHRLRRPPLQKATGPVDVLHATSIAIPPRSAPLVVTIHDLAFLDHPEMFTRRGLSFFMRGLDLAVKDADLVLCPSQATSRDCMSAGFSKDKVRVVPLGLDPDPVTPDAVTAVKERFGIERDYVIWTGTIEPRKNLEGLLAAWDSLDSGLELVLAGPKGWNEDLDALVSRASKPRVLGFVTRHDLHALYRGARLLAWPSLKEGFGFPVLEAMSHGTPVVTSKGTSMEELAGDAALLVDPRDPHAIAEAIGRVLSDPVLARSLSEAGRRRAAGYSWERTAGMLVDAYGDVL